jgi:cysteine synthase
LGEAIIPQLYSLAEPIVDQYVVIQTEEADEIARKITCEEGIFVGMSAGAAVGGP